MSPKSDKNDIVNGSSGRPPGSVDVSDNNTNENDSETPPACDPTRESRSGPGGQTRGRSSNSQTHDPTRESSSGPVG